MQHVLNGGGIPVGVVSSPAKVELLRPMGRDAVIDRRAAGYHFWTDDHTQDPSEWRRFGRDRRALVGEDPHIVFEHPGRLTMGASVFVCARGGTVVTCAATSGYMIEYDNRHLWMKLKTIKSSHFANYREASEANRHHNLREGKIAVRCLAPADGCGIDDTEFRARVGEERITRFRARPALEATNSARPALEGP